MNKSEKNIEKGNLYIVQNDEYDGYNNFLRKFRE